ncbi:MAG: (d)CMP kinase [Firmicutes bacterium]|nr:(d)CMP kinase [Bacillota bacterium]
MRTNKISVVFDGPAGVGKSTIAKTLAYRLNFQYIDTGAMYRTATLLALEHSLPLEADSERAIVDLVTAYMFRFVPDCTGSFRTYYGGRDVSELIRSEAVSAGVSLVAKLPGVRNALTEIQRQLAAESDVVMEGRDIGTVVLPHARYKFFLTASADKRAERRYLELKQTSEEVSLEAVRTNILTRDHLDSTRAVAPLSIPEDAIVIDTTELTIPEVLDKVLSVVNKC